MRLFRPGSFRGQSLVEFALAVPIFVLLLMGILDLGRAVYYNSTLSSAAREASRQGIVDQTCSHVTTEALNMSVAVPNPTVTVQILSPGGTLKSTCPTAPAPGLGDTVYVTVRGDFTAATPLIGNIVGTIHLRGESKFAVEAVCVQPTPATCPIGD